MSDSHSTFGVRLPVDVIVPVYRGLGATRRCLESVLAHPQSTAFSVVVVDDDSPERELKTYLAELAAKSGITLLTNESNLGFVASVNLGMSLHPDRDVVLLNSDTEIANDWLDRLCRCAYVDSDIGTVTPFTNNGTICSYPYEGWSGGVPGSLGLALLDKVFAQTNAGLSIELPTAVGFCMYIRRACLDHVGLFDAARFGRGYGEENDFSRRAAQAGWRNVLAADTFVFHEGAVSFSEERHGLQQAAMIALLEVHPDYLDWVHDFIRRDPVAPLRAAVDRARGWHGPAESRCLLDEKQARSGARAESMNDYRPVQLHLTHSWGGGTDRWVSDFIKGDQSRRNLVLRSRSDRNFAGWRLELLEPEQTDIPIMAWNLAEPIHATAIEHAQYRTVLSGIIDTFHIQGLYLSSLLGHALAALESGLPTTVILHDLYPYCPAMFGFFDEPCAACQSDRLQRCLGHNPLNAFWHNTEAADWQALRKAYAVRLDRDNINIVAPTQDVHKRWATLHTSIAGKPCQYIPHGIDTKIFTRPTGKATTAEAKGGRLRIVVPGRLLPHKGLRLLNAVLPDLLSVADVLLLGCGEFGKPFAGMPGIEIIQNYQLAALPGHVQTFNPDCALLLSILPESFSYTLSEMRALGVPSIATRIGAFAERIEHGVDGLLFDPEPSHLLGLVQALSEDRAPLQKIQAQLAKHHVRTLADMVLDYQALMPVVSTMPRSVGDKGLIEAVLRQEELEREAGWLRSEYHRLNGRVRAHADSAKRLAGEIEVLRVEQSKLKAERDGLLESTSWRMTAPMRELKRRFLVQSAGSHSSSEHDVAQVVSSEAKPVENEPNKTIVDWPALATLVGDRVEIRSRVRHEYGVPDRSRIVLSYGRPESPNGAERFMGIVDSCIALRNDVSCLMVESAIETPVWQPIRAQVSILEALRRVIVDQQGIGRSDWLLAADALILPEGAHLGTDVIKATLDLGLPILVFGALDGELEKNYPNQIVDCGGRVPDAVAVWLSRCFDEAEYSGNEVPPSVPGE